MISNKEKLFQGIIKDYDQESFPVEISRTSTFIDRVLSNDEDACIVCYEEIAPKDPIWSCPCCYAQYHLTCISKWVQENIAIQRRKAIEDTEQYPGIPTVNAAAVNSKQFQWSCPTCRQEFDLSHKPERYHCFCGKLPDPPGHAWLLPHSCGEHCDKQLTSCSHRCLLLCHPGPCPPCPRQLSAVSCHCSKGGQRTLRCGQGRWSCGTVCNRLLSCGQHRCSQSCHESQCSPCKNLGWQTCCCGKEKKMLACDSEAWHCNQLCNRLLECGNHKCQRPCHVGECGSCLWLAARHCPCGKTTYPGKTTCADKAGEQTVPLSYGDTSHGDLLGPPCEETCSRTLACGEHFCEDKCHIGECGLCRATVTRKCRCGATKSKVQCHRGEFTCQVKCSRLRDCGRHPCRRKCCSGRSGGCAPCDQVCNRPLACGHHRCKARCHAGPCYPCRERMLITCPCGQSERTIPCGLDKKAARLVSVTGSNNTTNPSNYTLAIKGAYLVVGKEKKKIQGLSVVCRKNCPKSSRCGVHANPHKCHDYCEECPVCEKICDSELKCGHHCPAKCHLAIPKVIRLDKSKLAGPWEARDDGKLEWHRLPCPPCRQLVPVRCIGGHEDIHVPCCELGDVSCGQVCNRPLECGNHQCSLICHTVGRSKPDLKTLSEYCESCHRDCEKPRPVHCVHPCSLLACHPGACPKCTRSAPPRRCHCGKLQIILGCVELGTLLAAGDDDSALNSRLCCPASCDKPLHSSCGHPCSRQCHAGPCEPVVCVVKVNLFCACKRRKVRMVCHKMQEENPEFWQCFKFNLRLPCQLDNGCKAPDRSDPPPTLDSSGAKLGRRGKPTADWLSREKVSLRCGCGKIQLQIGCQQFLEDEIYANYQSGQCLSCDGSKGCKPLAGSGNESAEIVLGGGGKISSSRRRRQGRQLVEEKELQGGWWRALRPYRTVIVIIFASLFVLIWAMYEVRQK